MQEREALRRCRAGDRTAFRVLVEQYGDLAYRVAYLMTHDRALAEDLAQDAFLAAWKGLRRFDPALPFKPWLLRIVVNTCRSRARRKAVPVLPLEEMRGRQGPSPDPSPEALAVAHDSHQAVGRAIAALDEEMRQAVMLRYFAGLTVPEIAAILAWPEGTVKSRLHRALARLRAELERQGVLGGADLPGPR